MPDRWPLVMDRATACRYLTRTRGQFDAMVGAGLLPPALKDVPGPACWNRLALDRAINRLGVSEAIINHADEEAALDRALERIAPTPIRRRDQERPR